MTNDNPRRLVLRRVCYFAAYLFLVGVIVCLIVGIEGARRAIGQRSREAFVQQSADSHFKEDTRIIEESKMPRKGAAVAFENTSRFVELANEMRLRCLVFPGVCSEADDMLPFLTGRKALRGRDPTR